MDIRRQDHGYQVGKRVADTGSYRLYLCVQNDSGRQCLLQIATDVAHNGALVRNAFFLGELKRQADALEAEFARVRKDPKVVLNYELGFPELVESFTSEDQGGRRVNILAFRKVEDVSRMVPIRNIIVRDRRRVDLRTSAWIMGKPLKLLAFAHSLGISVGRLDATNILIEPNQHYVLIFDWSDAKTDEAVPSDVASKEISKVAQVVIRLLGGNLEDQTIPECEGQFELYARLLFDFAREIHRDAKHAHEFFYELVDKLWERKFYPFTSHPL